MTWTRMGVNVDEYKARAKARRELREATSNDYQHMTVLDAAKIQLYCDDVSNLSYDLVSLFIEDPTLFDDRDRERLCREIREKLYKVNEALDAVIMRD
jgi:hypothetical protein